MDKKDSKTYDSFPSRIVCLSYDIFDIICELGGATRIVGKPKGTHKPGTEGAVEIGGFSKPDIETVIATQPDIVIGYSEICTNTMTQLTNLNINTLTLHHTSLEEIYQSIKLLGGMIGKPREATNLTEAMQGGFLEVAVRASRRSHRPVIYFEEWNNPYVCGTQWVSEVIGMVGGKDGFAHICHHKKFTERKVTTEEVIAARPEIILASWCGNPVDVSSIKRRPGWEAIPAVKHNLIYEVPGEMILQPGLSLTRGARFISDIIDKYAN